MIGLGSGFSASFSTSAVVRDFLPEGGAPAAFTANHTDPTTTSPGGVLAGQALALTLSVEFDQCDANFGASNVELKDLVVDDDSSPCVDMTVQQVLDEGNAVLSGGGTLTPAQINGCMDSINNNFVDGTSVGTFLALP